MDTATNSSAEDVLAAKLEPAHNKPSSSDEEKAANAENSTENTRVDLNEEPKRSITGVKWALVCTALYISCILYGLDTTVAADVQGAVTKTFKDVSQLAWIGAGFPLGSVAVALPYGAAYTLFDMKWLFIAGVALLEIGSTLCGAAPSMNALIIGRVIAGVGGTGLYLGCLNYMSAITTPRERGTYITSIGFAWGIGLLLGPVVGGAFSESSATWRWAFYINLVVGAVLAPIYLFCLPSLHPSQNVPLSTRLMKLDGVGSVLSAAMWCTFAFAFISAGSLWAWNDGRTIAMIVVFVLIVAAYALQQYFCIFTTKDSRSFPGHLIPRRSHTLLFIANAAGITTTFIGIFFIPIYFQFVWNDGPLKAAVRILPFVLILVSANLAGGYLLSKIRYYMPIFMFSGIMMTIGGALFYHYLRPDTSAGIIYAISIITALGSGINVQLTFAVATLIVEPKDVIPAISYQYVSQLGGTVIALVIAGQIFQSQATANLMHVLGPLGFSDTDIQSAVAGAQSPVFARMDPDVRSRAVLAITDGMRLSFTLIIISGGMMILASAFMKREKLFGKVVLA